MPGDRELNRQVNGSVLLKKTGWEKRESQGLGVLGTVSYCVLFRLSLN